MDDSAVKDGSPYPSQGEMDLDMWRAVRPNPSGNRRIMRIGPTESAVIAVCPLATNEADRDVMARRIEGMGDLYEALRRAAERMIEAGMDVSDEHRALTEFVSPKPFAEGC